MGSIRELHPVKLFVGVLAPEEARISGIEERIVERLTAKYGPMDHRSSVIPMGVTLHRVFFSFERLVEAALLSEIRRQSDTFPREFSSTTDVGFVDNRRVVLALTENDSHDIDLGNDIFGEVAMQFKNGAVQFLPSTHMDYQSIGGQDFFLTMRRIYRDQLRSMCLLRK